MTRKFEDRPAVREKTPLLIGLVGPSGTGKTMSALRLAAGMQRVTGGQTFVIDSEARRSLHYAKRFSFRIVPFGAPFGSLDYLSAIEHCVAQGATNIIVDSMSHEHEGPGGMLEAHAAELARMGGGDNKKMLAWARPKADRRRLINTILQLPVNLLFCFRAKEKLKIEKGKDPRSMGWMAIAGEEFIYEMTINFLLLPGANGVPAWSSDEPGEQATMKLPEQFRDAFAKSAQLDEGLGELMARWAAGDLQAVAHRSAAEIIASYATCSDPATFRTLREEHAAAWKSIPSEDKPRLKAAAKETEERLVRAAEQAEATSQGTDPAPADVVALPTINPTAAPDLDADIAV